MFIFNLFASFAQLERDIIIQRTRAGLESSRRRGLKIGRKPGLSNKALHKAMLAERYYRDNKLSIEEIMKLIDVGSKKTLYKIWHIKAEESVWNAEIYFGIRNNLSTKLIAKSTKGISKPVDRLTLLSPKTQFFTIGNSLHLFDL